MLKNHIIFRAFLFSAAALGVFASSAAFGTSFFTEWLGILAGVLTMGAAIPCHLLGKKQKFLYFLSFLFNSVGCGFSASAYYTTEKINADLGELFAAALILAVFLFASSMLYCFTTEAFTAACVTLCVLDALIAAFAVYGWMTDGDAFFSFLFFSSLIALFYIFAMRKAAKEYDTCDIARTVSLHSFGIFILITVIVLALISEGEIFDGFDSSNFKDVKKKNKGKAITGAVIAAEALDTAADIVEESRRKRKAKKSSAKNPQEEKNQTRE